MGRAARVRTARRGARRRRGARCGRVCRRVARRFSGGFCESRTGEGLARSASAALRRLAPGRPLVVYVAAAPCRSCLDGARTLSAVARRRPGIAFAAVAAGDTRREAAGFFRLARWPGARLLDERGTLAGGLGVRSLPTTLVLSARRRVVLRIEGAIGAALVVRAALRA